MRRILLFVLIGYLSESVLYARLVCSLFGKKDCLQKSGDGNPGTANAYQYGGFWCGTMTLLCDLFLSKPGGLSSTEAAVVGTALIHVPPIPGCETHNMRFFEERGMCVAVSSPQEELLSACDRLMNETERQRMRLNRRRFIPSHATAASAV